METEVKQILGMSLADRILEATEKIELVRARFVDHLRIRAQNEHLVYTSLFEDRLNNSHAGFAYASLQQSLYYAEVISLCSLWSGRADHNEITLKRIVELVKSDEISSDLSSQYRQGLIENGLYDTDPDALEADVLSHTEALITAIDKSKIILESAEWKQMSNARDTFMAHSLSESWKARKAGGIDPTKVGFEELIMNQTIEVLDNLYFALKFSHRNLDEPLEGVRKQASDLWRNVIFERKD